MAYFVGCGDILTVSHRLQCDSAKYIADSTGACKLKPTQATCGVDGDCVANAKCDASTPKKCECDATKFFVKNSAGDACELKLNKGTCSADTDCVTVDDVKCNSETCGCDASKNKTPNSAKTACECTSDYTLEVTKCACASDAQSMTVDGKTYCGKKIGGACLLEADACSGRTCKSTKKGSVDFYTCQCQSGTAQPDGTCSRAEDVTGSLAVLLVGLVTSVLAYF
ncbi:hypothetical protein ACOMHN_004861 [Nucella lapillus]